MKRKYKIRKLSPLWWVTRVGGTVFTVATFYCMMCFAVALGA